MQRLLSELRGNAGGSGALQTWIAVVERSLVDPSIVLIDAIDTETDGQVPLWWPDEA